MSSFESKSAAKVAPSMIELGMRVLWLVGALLIISTGLWLALTWHTISQRQIQRMSVAATLAATDADGYFGLLRVRGRQVADQLRRRDVLRHPQAALPILRRFTAGNPDLTAAMVIRTDGQVLASSPSDAMSGIGDVMSNPSRRAEFERSLSTRGLLIKPPQRSGRLRNWAIPMQYVVRDRKGNALFLFQFRILLKEQQALWKELQLVPGVIIGLMRDDGTPVCQVPDQIQARDGAASRAAAVPGNVLAQGKESGLYTSTGADGSSRVGVYERLTHYPLYVYLSIPKSVVAQVWWQYARIPLYLLVSGLFAGIVIYGIVAGRFARRMRVIGDFFFDEGQIRKEVPPSSGVFEIDHLCESLVDARRRLRETAENREKLLLSAARAGTYAVRQNDGIVIDADEVFVNMLGKTPAQVVGCTWASLLAEPAAAEESRMQGHLDSAFSATLRFNHAGRKPLWLSVAEYTEESQAGIIRYGLTINVSERELLLSELHSQSRRMQALWQVASDRTLTDSAKIQLILGFGVGTLGMETAMIGEISGERYIIRHVIDAIGIFERDQEMLLDDTLCRFVAQDDTNLYVDNVSTDARFRDYPGIKQFGINTYVSAAIRLEDKIFGTLVFLRRKPADHPFTEDDRAFIDLLASWLSQFLQQQKRRAELEVMAMSDSLTGLPNRRAAEIRIGNELAQVRRGGERFSIAICDLDNFKLINDHFGHDVGDIVLRHVADVIRGALREGDWVARWGGEEFIIFFFQSTPADALAASERIRQAIRSQPVEKGHTLLEVTASLGIGVLTSSDENIEHVLLDADDCLYEAKKRGRDRVVAADMASSHTLRRSHMLQQALQEKRLVPAYQCMVDLQNGKVVAEEALARLVLANGDILPAGEFIEAAEGLNMIHRVDNLVARQTMERCSALERQGVILTERSYFINLSPQFLARKDMVEALLRDVDSLYSKGGAQSTLIRPFVFEITERQFVTDINRLHADLQPLLDFGFRVALDDFGSGYSSFLYLAKLPVSFLKIEGWMVQNMRHNEQILQMIKSMVMLTQTLGVTTIAECVEDRETADMLRDLGVDWGQGYFFGHPQCDEAYLARFYGS
ncbi:MAG: EAL domain-containing protein [Acidiferrobacterales bacterium]